MIFKTILIFLFLSVSFLSFAQKRSMRKISVQIFYTPAKPLNRFIPSQSLGAAFDGHWQGEINRIMKDSNIALMKTVGLKPVSYRLRTELGVEAWHWNPVGTWSDEKNLQGYWTSDENSKKPIQLSHGYFLPRRGNTHDNANDNGYSRIDDGDTTTIWKSNPYLDHYFTREPDSLHPQWVVVDLGKLKKVNAIRINWSNPYALAYKLEYAADIGNDYFEPYQPGLWHALTKKSISNEKGENKIISIPGKPIQLRFVKITFFQSSYTATMPGNDIRDKLGFAIKEIQLGLLDKKNIFHDYVHHGKDNRSQSVIHVSSTDPWHRAIDMDVNTEQVGIDRFYQSGLANNIPAMLPIALLYDTPDNMMALLHYVFKKKYPVRELEMGEEPEGQLIHPTDYGSLYLEFAEPIKKFAPQLKLGGPGFASLAKDGAEDQFSFSERQWTKLFLDYLKKHNGLNQFNFFSFEWYPFDDICSPAAQQLAVQPKLFAAAVKPFTQTILLKNTPVYITEYGYSAYSGQHEVTIEGGLMYADIIGEFLALGGSKSFLYGYDPTYPDESDHCGWGNNMLFGMNENGKIIYKTAAYYTVQMMTGYWAKPADSVTEIYPVKVADPLISAYALRANNKWSVALINKDPEHSKNISISVQNRNGTFSTLHFPLQCIQYSGLQYHWKNEGAEGHPDKSLPPQKKIIKTKNKITLPPYSLTVLKEEN